MTFIITMNDPKIEPAGSCKSTKKQAFALMVVGRFVRRIRLRRIYIHFQLSDVINIYLPAWSLFFEYLSNILSGLFVRKFSKTALSILVFISAVALVYLAVTSPSGDIIGRWSLTSEQLRIGFTRVMYPFFAGLLLFRIGKLTRVNHAFFWCSLLTIIVFSVPRIGGSQHLWMNGLYDSLTVIIIFPLIVFMGASGEIKGKYASRICQFSGDISYPLYITHYPLIYLYTGWVADHKISMSQAWPFALLTFFSSIVIAYACLKLYDEPVRRWLKRKVLLKTN